MELKRQVFSNAEGSTLGQKARIAFYDGYHALLRAYIRMLV